MSKIHVNKDDYKMVDLEEEMYIADVSVEIDSHINRKTQPSTIKKYIACAGGFHRGLWQPPLVAKLPDGSMKLFDGDHRRVLWKLAYPDKASMPAQIINVESEQEISKYFMIINKTGRKGLSPEELFVHEVHAGVPSAVKTNQDLKKANLCVSLGTGEEGSVVGATGGRNVKIGGFKTAVRDTGIDPVVSSSKLIQKTWPEEKVRPELLGGIARVFKNTKIDADNNFMNAFTNYMKNMAYTTGVQADVAKAFKAEGGDRTNKAQDSIALGIIEKFRKSPISRVNIGKSKFYKYFGKYKRELNKILN